MKVAIVIGHNIKARGAVNENGMSEFAQSVLVSENLPYDVFHLNERLSYKDACTELGYKLNDYDLALHLHFNYFDDEEVSGCEALYWEDNRVGKLFADDFIHHISNAYGIKMRRALPISNKKQRGYYAISKSPCTTLILEPYFGSNKSDTEMFSDYRRYAKEIIKFVDKCQRQQVK